MSQTKARRFAGHAAAEYGLQHRGLSDLEDLCRGLGWKAAENVVRFEVELDCYCEVCGKHFESQDGTAPFLCEGCEEGRWATEADQEPPNHAAEIAAENAWLVRAEYDQESQDELYRTA